MKMSAVRFLRNFTKSTWLLDNDWISEWIDESETLPDVTGELPREPLLAAVPEVDLDHHFLPIKPENVDEQQLEGVKSEASGEASSVADTCIYCGDSDDQDVQMLDVSSYEQTKFDIAGKEVLDGRTSEGVGIVQSHVQNFLPIFHDMQDLPTRSYDATFEDVELNHKPVIVYHLSTNSTVSESSGCQRDQVPDASVPTNNFWVDPRSSDPGPSVSRADKSDSVSGNQESYSSKNIFTEGAAVTPEQHNFLEIMRRVNDKFECAQCGKTYQCRTSVYQHYYVHHKGKSIACKQCDRKFMCDSDLSRHMLLHTKEKPHTCHTCGKTFRLSSQVTMHQVTHSEERRFSCQQCGKTFKQSQKLYRHKRIHELRSDASLQCNVCKKMLCSQQALQNHMFRHSDEKPFKCEFCDKCYSTKVCLRSHLVVHTTGYKKKLCALCGKYVGENAMTLHLKVHAGEKPFKCEVCGKAFPRKSNLIGHMRTHTGEKPYLCKTCGKSFSLYSNMVTHCRKCERDTAGET